MINVAVVGSRYWKKNLIRNFDKLVSFHTICDHNPETLRCFKEKYPDKECQTSLEIVLQNRI
jgi:UDP-2-acetamido-3-amino-2,3-dideoxy-glucuronate N-acetyltransferase